MVYVHDKINKLTGGWYVVYKDGNVLTEEESLWVQVPNKKDIQIMGLKWRHKCFELEGKGNYVAPGETHTRDLSIGGTNPNEIRITKPSLVGRFIGYYDEDCKVLIRLDIETGNFFEERISYQTSSNSDTVL